MAGLAVVEGGSASRQWAGNGRRHVEVALVHLQAVDFGIVVDVVMWRHLGVVGLGDEMHAPVFKGGRLEGQPHAQGQIVAGRRRRAQV